MRHKRARRGTAVEQLQHRRFHLEVIPAEQRLAQAAYHRCSGAHHLAGLALEAVAADGVLVHALGHGDAQARQSGVGEDAGMQAEVLAVQALAFGEGGLELARDAQARGGRESRRSRHRRGPQGDAGPAGRGAKRRRVTGAASDAEAGAALGAATGQDLAAIGGGHAGAEAVVALALEVAGLVGTLGGHGGTPVEFLGGKDRGL